MLLEAVLICTPVQIFVMLTDGVSSISWQRCFSQWFISVSVVYIGKLQTDGTRPNTAAQCTCVVKSVQSTYSDPVV